MRRKQAIVACAGLALSLLIAGCNPATDRRYIDEGAGVNLNVGDGATQTELLKEYIAYICDQMGADQTCIGNWTTFVQAGMNDIDQRCDGFLTWLDARRRDKEPVLAEMAAVTAATHSIMTVTGASPKSLDIVTAAFGLASASYTNWNSRLLISVNQSTVQEVVYNNQGKFRDKIKAYSVPDQPTAIYLLRNYLRICMPITIEATFNTSTTLVERSPSAAAAASMSGNLVVANVTPPRTIANPATPLQPQARVRQQGATRLTPEEQALTPRMIGFIQVALCVPRTGDLGPLNSTTRAAMQAYLVARKKSASQVIDSSNDFLFDEAVAKVKSRSGGTCATAGFANATAVGQSFN